MQDFKDFLSNWESRLVDVGYILDYLNSYPHVNEVASFGDLITSKELFKRQEEWFKLNSKYKGAEREFFKNYWVPISSNSYEYFIDISDSKYRLISTTFIPIDPCEYIIQVSFESITELMSLLDSNIEMENINIFLKEKRFNEIESLLENRANKKVANRK
jgi:hypothetical protein